MKTDKEIVKEVTTICALYELGGYTAAEAFQIVYKLLAEGENGKNSDHDPRYIQSCKRESNIKFEVPKNCGSCLSIEQFGNKYICGMPVFKEKEMLDISAVEVDINSRPHWCPKNKVINIISNLSEENKVLFDRMCDGFSAMFELMGSQKDGN